jgi:hypothetical protein
MIKKIPFLEPSFNGARFDDHTMPVEVLSELSSYKKIIVEVAKAVFRHQNPGRQRVPRGFERGLELSVSTISEGSAVPLLERSVAPGEQLAVGGDCFDVARQIVADLISSEKVPTEVPVDVLKLFNGFGNTLQAGEWIGLKSPASEEVPRYDRAKRKALVLLASTTYEDDCDVTGEVVQFDTDKMTFTLLVEGARVMSAMLDTQLPVVRDVAGRGGVAIRVVGTGLYDGADKLSRIMEITDLSLANETEFDIQERLARLANLSEGWLDGVGKAVMPIGTEQLASLLSALETLGLSKPFLFPTEDGGIQAEWSFPDTEVVVEFSASFDHAEVHGTHLRSLASREGQVDLGAANAIQAIGAFVESFAPGAPV